MINKKKKKRKISKIYLKILKDLSYIYISNLLDNDKYKY